MIKGKYCFDTDLRVIALYVLISFILQWLSPKMPMTLNGAGKVSEKSGKNAKGGGGRGETCLGQATISK